MGSHGKLPSGSTELDSLIGGGIDWGTATLMIGPAGSGKSTLALRYAISAARGEKVAMFAFDERVRRPCCAPVASGSISARSWKAASSICVRSIPRRWDRASSPPWFASA